MSEPKFHVGQVVMWDRRGNRRDIPVQILEAVEHDGNFFYRIDKNNSLHEAMIRPLNDLECGTSPASSGGE